jgi:hypothetical protein
MLEALPAHARPAAALVIALAGLAVPLLLARAMLADDGASADPPSAGRRFARSRTAALTAVGGAVTATIVLFQAAAVRLSPALLGVAPALALLAFAVWRYRGSA